MTQKTFRALVEELLPYIRELFPWDLEEKLKQNPGLLVVDIRESDEFSQGAIQNSLHIPRGILESASDWGYSDTVPELAGARDKPVILVCRSGNRSVLAANTLQQMGFKDVYSLKTGIRGWNDYELPLHDLNGKPVDIDEAEMILNPPVKAEQINQV